MKIIGISTMRDEPYAADPINHLYSQGCDEVIVSVEKDDDLTYKALVSVTLPVACRLPFDQAREITKLAKMAAGQGADWIIPFDADEYWIGTQHLTIREALTDATGLHYVYAPMYLHISLTCRSVDPKPLPKIAFRPYSNMQITWGSHSANVSGPGTYGLLEVRELQYRDYPHFLAKIETARHLHNQPHMNPANGSHMVRLCNMTEQELEAEWAGHLATPTVIDPIP